ncbi:MAG: hypothetical protein ABRQ38_26920 [Candidatus Eremiobacterota bacterium]
MGKMKKGNISSQTDIVQQSAAQINNLPSGYGAFLKELKLRISSSQLRASLSVNRELLR